MMFLRIVFEHHVLFKFDKEYFRSMSDGLFTTGGSSEMDIILK